VWGPDDDVRLPALVRKQRARALTLVDGGRWFVPTAYVQNVASAIALATTAPAAAGNVYYVTDDERVRCRAFLQQLLGAVGLAAPRRSLPYGVAYALAWWAEKTSATPWLTRTEAVRLGRPALFNLKRTREDLGYAPQVGVAQGARALARWATAVGGADAIVSGEAFAAEPEWIASAGPVAAANEIQEKDPTA
jgi:nucleoside-diphosphate-sugar epimerase